MKKITLFMFAIFLFQFPNFSEASESEDKNNSTIAAVNELEDIQKTIDEVYGNTEKFEKNGTLYFDEEGNAVFLIKKEKMKLNSTHSLKQKLQSKVSKNSKINIKEVQYSTSDWVEKQNDVIKAIVNYDKKLLTEGHIDVSLSLTHQKLTLKSKKEIPKELKNLLDDVSNGLLQYQVTDELIIYKEEKGRFEGWNNLGGGLAIKVQGQPQPGQPFCSTGPVAKKGSDYFLLTAGHCFFPTGTLVYQYNETLGREHAIGNSAGYDVGLIKVTSDNTLPKGRLATNGILVRNNSEGYDNSFNRTADVYEGLPVCKSGFRTGHTCGVVIEKYGTATDSRNNIVNVTEVRGTGADYSDGGDSGAATISNNTSGVGSHAILGTHFGGYDTQTETYGAFTRIVDTIRIFGVEIHTSSTPARIIY